MRITFLGGTGTVTGSKYLVESGARRILVDCGLFQGYKQLRLRNWRPLPVEARSIDAVLLTHAHIDHSGYLPILVRQGFAGKVYCTRATADLLRIMLPDSGHLQEEEARLANRHGYSKHRPALPLYDVAEALRALESLVPVDFEADLDLGEQVRGRFTLAGHILGAAMIRLETPKGSVLFSGDVGRPYDPIMLPPGVTAAADALVVESTYGDRRHPAVDAQAELADAINAAAARGGVIVVPAFAVGRAQTVLWLVSRLKAQRAIPDLPVFLNSPMATNVTQIYGRYLGEHRLSLEQCEAMSTAASYVNSAEDSKALNLRHGPMMIVSASGMATGGRVLHHLEAFAPDARNMILLTGFQSGGTRGASLAAGEGSIKIHGRFVPVRAEVRQLTSASAHADGDELLDWLRRLGWTPRRVFVTHGEPPAADRLRQRLQTELRWSAEVPDYLETVQPLERGIT